MKIIRGWLVVAAVWLSCPVIWAQLTYPKDIYYDDPPIPVKFKGGSPGSRTLRRPTSRATSCLRYGARPVMHGRIICGRRHRKRAPRFSSMRRMALFAMSLMRMRLMVTAMRKRIMLRCAIGTVLTASTKSSPQIANAS